MFSKIKYLLVALSVAALTACGGGGMGDDFASVPDSPFAGKSVSFNQATVDVYGDSISIGVGVEISPIMRLNEYRPNWVVDHHSAGGLRLDSLVAGYSEPFPGASPIYFPKGPQLPFAEVERNSRFVVIGLGINDALNDQTASDAQRYEDHLRYVVRTLLAEKRIPILTGVVNIASNPMLRGHYNIVTHKIAEEYGLVHAGWGEAYGAEGVGADTIHPNQMGSDRLAGQLIEAIDKAIAIYGVNPPAIGFAGFRSAQVN